MPTPMLRVLLVDDNHDAVDAIAMLLESEGYEIRTAHDGVTALKEAQAWLPEVIILDIGLPGLNGYQVAQALRQSPLSSQPLLIALSGYGGDRDRQLARTAGFDHHVVKPAEPDQLFALLASRAR
jgi:CheY-like chemotaxis protein